MGGTGAARVGGITHDHDRDRDRDWVRDRDGVDPRQDRGR